MLIGSKIKLRAPISTDIDFLFKLRNDFEIQMSLMSLPRANTRERVNTWIAGILNDPDCVFYYFRVSNRQANGLHSAYKNELHTWNSNAWDLLG